MSFTKIEYSVIVPVYKNEASVPDLLDRISRLHNDLGKFTEFVIVVDGSPDRSYEFIKEGLTGKDYYSQLVLLSRNFGSFAAIRTGLEVSRGQYCVVMSADLQEPADLIIQLLKRIDNEAYDIGIGTRITRRDSFLPKFSSNTFWWLYRKLVQKDIPLGGVDIFSCNNRVKNVLLKLQENNSSLVGLLFWIGFKRVLIPYHRETRQHGKSAWNFPRKIRYFLDSCFGFTDLPITLLIATGAAGIVLSFSAMLIIVIAYIFDTITVPGYAPIMIAILFSFALNLFGIGIVGAYVWRNFENSKGRPLSILMQHEIFDREI